MTAIGKYGESRVLEWHGCQTYRIFSTPAMFPSDNGHCWAYVKTKTHVSNSALANWMDSRKQTILVDTALVLMRKSQHVFRMLLYQSAWPHRFPTRLPWLGCVKESKRGKKCRVTWVIWVWFFIAFQKIDHCWFLFDPPMPQKWRPAKTIQNPILIPIDNLFQSQRTGYPPW